MQTADSNFGYQLKSWRAMRKISQLDLALDAAVSQRHLSWLETGKSKPSREMVIQLAEVLDVPLRSRNNLLVSAGYAPLYAESKIDATSMEPVQQALRKILAHHEPLPAMVLDRMWCTVMTNTAADKLLALFGDTERLWGKVDPSGRRSIARLTLHPEGMRPYIANWSQVVGMFLHRLRKDALASGSATEQQEYEALLELAGSESLDGLPVDQNLLPVLPLVLEHGPLRLELFSVISTFGTAQDITVDELRIETFFPGDDVTEKFFAAL